MRGLFDAVPDSIRGAHAADAAALAPMVAGIIGRDDAILVKGSLGSGMKCIIEAIEAAKVPAHQAGDA
jgi:UDP-N-acetylmuramoyl-tripeptide--D-alanyl-D-alanine ligase